MKNHELLDMIGQAGEDYVLEAGNDAARPRFRWKIPAVCAACAALVLAAYPVYRAFNRPLHDYTVVEGGGILDTQGDVKAPAGDPDVPVPAPVPSGGHAVEVGDERPGNGCGLYDVPGRDAPAQEAAQALYQGLLQGLGGQGGYQPETYPDWFAGAWIDNDYYPEARLRVAIVDGFRTAELEAQILNWCGGMGDVVFRDANYSLAYLDSLMEPAVKALDGANLSCGIGVDVMDNCLGVDIYGDFIPDAVLAELARLDPDGDAIRVREFTGPLSITDELVKGPAIVESAAAPADPVACPTPIDGSEHAPDTMRDSGAREADQPDVEPAGPVDGVIFEGE